MILLWNNLKIKWSSLLNLIKSNEWMDTPNFMQGLAISIPWVFFFKTTHLIKNIEKYLFEVYSMNPWSIPWIKSHLESCLATILMRCKYRFKSAPHSLIMRFNIHNFGQNLELKFNHDIEHLHDCASPWGENYKPCQRWESTGKHLLIVLLASFSLSCYTTVSWIIRRKLSPRDQPHSI